MKNRILNLLRSIVLGEAASRGHNSGKKTSFSEAVFSESARLQNFKVEVDTESNVVSLGGLVKARGSLKIVGTDNEVSFGERSSLNCRIRIQGSGNRLIVGDDCNLRGQILIKGSSQTVSVGDATTFQSVYLLCQEGCDIIIGRRCMFSREIEVRTTDAHSLVDLSTKSRINKPQSIMIGDHVWVGLRALINKGASVPDDCIVGAAAFVNAPYTEPHTVLAGVPAKVVRRNVTWNRRRKQAFTENELLDWK